MSDPSTILSYYPTYSLLDEVLTIGNYDTLNIYIDLKNTLQSLYMQHAILNIVESTLNSNFVDTSVFESVIQFLSFHKVYAANRKIKINFFIFFESGKSYYHLNISKSYKIKRRIDDLYGLDREKRDLFFEVLQKNYMLIEKSCNKMPNIHVIRLQNLEADFVPYYLISRNLVDTSNNIAHLIYSNDHDLLQCVNFENTFVYVKVPKVKKLIKKGQSLKSYLKYEKKYPDEYLPLVMSIIGDTGDDVYGIKGLGPKTVDKILDEIVEMVGGIENLYTNVFNGKPIFNTNSGSNLNKYINQIVEKEEKEKLISNNLKLVSFELISRFLDYPNTTDLIEKRNSITEALNKREIVDVNIMKKVLEMNRVFLNNDALETIYFLGG